MCIAHDDFEKQSIKRDNGTSILATLVLSMNLVVAIWWTVQFAVASGEYSVELYIVEVSFNAEFLSHFKILLDVKTIDHIRQKYIRSLGNSY